MTGEHLNSEAIRFLRQRGIANPVRLVRLIRETISFLELDLKGLTVLTEAASGPYVVTPVIAALANAERVIAITADSRFASAEEVVAQTRALEALSGVDREIEVHTERSPELFARADIVTNLGFVRPIDERAVQAMKQLAAVPLMCEAWEFRSGDVDLAACRRRGIPILGTNEDYPGLDVFQYSGWLCLKMLLEAELEVHKSRILIVSGDKFGRVIEKLLARSGVAVCLLDNLREIDREQLARGDALVVADYLRDDVIIGAGGDIGAVELAQLNQGITVIQFAGRVDTQGLAENGIKVYPGIELDAHRMAMTLSGLGPRPVVELHAAGLKVGEIAVRKRARLPSLLLDKHGLLQEVNPVDASS
jgi:hypothetical protein